MNRRFSLSSPAYSQEVDPTLHRHVSHNFSTRKTSFTDDRFTMCLLHAPFSLDGLSDHFVPLSLSRFSTTFISSVSFSFFYPSFLSFNPRETLVVWTACIEQRSTISLFYHPRDENRVQSPMWYGLCLIQWYFVEYMKLLDFVLTEFLLFLIGSLSNILF